MCGAEEPYARGWDRGHGREVRKGARKVRDRTRGMWGTWRKMGGRETGGRKREEGDDRRGKRRV